MGERRDERMSMTNHAIATAFFSPHQAAIEDSEGGSTDFTGSGDETGG